MRRIQIEIFCVASFSSIGVFRYRDGVAWTGNVNSYNRIDHNHFGPWALYPELGDQEEVIQVGRGDYPWTHPDVAGGATGAAGLWEEAFTPTYTTIEYNFFEHWTGDTETISIKSSNCTVRGNVSFECEGAFNMRNAFSSIVDGNFLISLPNASSAMSHGIVLQGHDSVVTNNYIWGPYTGIYLGSGNIQWGTNGYPLDNNGGAGSPYFPAQDCIVANNTGLQMLRGLIRFIARSPQTEAQQNCIFINNQAEDTTAADNWPCFGSGYSGTGHVWTSNRGYAASQAACYDAANIPSGVTYQSGYEVTTLVDDWIVDYYYPASKTVGSAYDAGSDVLGILRAATPSIGAFEDGTTIARVLLAANNYGIDWDSFWPQTDLERGRRYYYRMRYRDANGADSAWSTSGDYFALGNSADSAIELSGVSISAQAVRTITSSSSIMLGPLDLSGQARAGVTATSAITLGSADLDAVAEREILATSEMTLGALDLDAATARNVTSSGALTLGRVDLDGVGKQNNAEPLQMPGAKYYWRIRFRDADGLVSSYSNGADYFITGSVSGSIDLGEIEIAGVAEREITSTSEITLGELTIAGAVYKVVTATSAITLGELELDGDGKHVITTNGALTFQRVRIVGTGTRNVTATSALTLGAIDIDAVTGGGPTAIGALTLGSPTIAGRTAKYATGAITLGEIAIVGLGAGFGAVIPVTTRIVKRYTVTTRIVKRYTVTTDISGENA